MLEHECEYTSNMSVSFYHLAFCGADDDGNDDDDDDNRSDGDAGENDDDGDGDDNSNGQRGRAPTNSVRYRAYMYNILSTTHLFKR